MNNPVIVYQVEQVASPLGYKPKGAVFFGDNIIAYNLG
jgi:hypothetical protein